MFQLLYLRIVSMLFSTSDFKHAVCTPAMVLLSQVLAQVVTTFLLVMDSVVWCYVNLLLFSSSFTLRLILLYLFVYPLQSPVRCMRDVFRGLFVCDLLLEVCFFVCLSCVVLMLIAFRYLWLSKPVGKDLTARRETSLSWTIMSYKNVKVFFVNFLLQYVSLSKRFVPEAVNFLCGILFLASKKESPSRK